MKVTIEYSAHARLKKFVTWIYKRIQDPVHKDNLELLNEFMNKVVLKELSRLESQTDTIPEEIEIPNEMVPIKEIQEALKKEATKPKKQTGIYKYPTEPKPEREYKDRSGNNHSSDKVRKLTDSEKDIIRSEFMRVNGEIHEDTCLEFKKKLCPEVGIFQVTGFVTWLHLSIARGDFRVINMERYLKVLKENRKKTQRKRKAVSKAA